MHRLGGHSQTYPLLSLGGQAHWMMCEDISPDSHLLKQAKQSSLTCMLLKPIWTYGMQLWSMASTSNIEILERFQSEALRKIVDTHWYLPNTGIQGISNHQQLNKKSSATALNTELASSYMAVRLSALRTSLALLPRNIIFLLLVLISDRC
jgi:hypothetical protein